MWIYAFKHRRQRHYQRAAEQKKERKKDERKEERLRHKFVEVNIALHEERRPLRYGNHYGNVAKDKTCKLDIRQRTADVN